MQTAAKTQDPAAGLAAYSQAQAAGTSVNPDLFSTLLYLCSGGDSWELSLRQQLVESTPLVDDILQRVAAAAAEAENATAVAVETAAGSEPTTAVATDGAGGHSPAAQGSAANGHSIAVECLTTASSPASQENLGGNESGSAVAQPPMSFTELNKAGRAIFEHMQVGSNQEKACCH